MNFDKIYENFSSDFYHERECKRLIIKELADSIERLKITDSSLLQNIQWEIDTLNFQLQNEGITWAAKGSKQDGSPYEYPDIKNYVGEKLRYIIDRYESTSVEFVKCRYGHVLWKAGKKDNRIAKHIAEHYYKVSTDLLSREDKKHIALLLFRNAFRFTLISKDKELTSEMSNFVVKKAHSIDSPDQSWINFAFISLMTQYKNNFKVESFSGIVDRILETHIGTVEGHNLISVLHMCEKVDRRTNSDSSRIYELLGEANEKLSYDSFDPGNMILPRFAQKASQFYKRSGNLEKEGELRKRYELLKSKMKLGEIKIEVDLTDMINEVENLSDKIIEQDPNTIFMILTYDERILPKYSEILNMVNQQKIENSFMSIFSGSVIDNNGHVAEHFTTEEEHLNAAIFQNCNYSMNFCHSHLHSRIFYKGVSENKITADNIFNFFTKGTWLGQNITRTIRQNEEEVYNWIYMIMPSITEYITQLRTHIDSGVIPPFSILSMDSLVLKFEGILRDVVNIRGGDTSYLKNDEKGRPVAREKDINALLKEPVVKNFYNKSDYMMLRYTLIEKTGLNLRNRIGHSLFRNPFNYSIQYMNLLIILIFRISREEYHPR